ncbi:hypothetical protein [Staphylococcus haemolyticus]|uniref:Putative membrane protein n=1 Tax=Cronobacter phage vB_CsaM_GAP31 TaxID=1141135 RepID=K4F5H0_9CAUD|nr:hypothetical protein [Staphylococcus haemolyticus]YP_006987071.1 hypothetical protein GAP31_235 [Cronobacter phage vB_CsaM_GAP31]AFC21416.1 putative membrane protein [Cronobacter phage vB_CsaM_GAP31]MCC3723687.1 transmembrane Fragile-X-F protein [Staphylococcus haemolyticus]
MKIGFMALLALVFITLKLCGVIAWSWWLVLLPLYFGIAFIIGVIVLFILGVFGVAGVASIIEKLKKKR